MVLGAEWDCRNQFWGWKVPQNSEGGKSLAGKGRVNAIEEPLRFFETNFSGLMGSRVENLYVEKGITDSTVRQNKQGKREGANFIRKEKEGQLFEIWLPHGEKLRETGAGDHEL